MAEPWFVVAGISASIVAIMGIAFLLRRRMKSGTPPNLKLIGSLLAVLGGINIGSYRGDGDAWQTIGLGCVLVVSGLAQVYSGELQAWRNKGKAVPGAH